MHDGRFTQYLLLHANIHWYVYNIPLELPIEYILEKIGRMEMGYLEHS